MVALGHGAGIAFGGLGGGLAVHEGALIVRVAHAGGGEFGEYRIQVGAGFRI
ncbi:Uncharacterised protein [Mycobacteroides abscessus subsp. massiliense]|nr:Uncharacterised protein [Mycobacteroides abscessus subsp. massiliense]SLJ05878.1 Uncharacterised protein [Mycobacteroides abscessus subsp. massiliense]